MHKTHDMPAPTAAPRTRQTMHETHDMPAPTAAPRARPSPAPGLPIARAALVAVSALAALAPHDARAARPAKVPAGEAWPPPKPLKIDRFTLGNGMRVVVLTDRRAPLVAMGLMVDVGSRDEVKGRSGLAHFFEHMMFQGSQRVGKMEHFRALEAVGASLNANTSTDRTYYYEVVPKGALPLAMWMETDRFATLKITPTNVENQRQTVMEERRQRYGNAPYRRSGMRLRELALTSWALGHPTIGSMEDLEQTPTKDFEAFWRKWYTPNNVVLSLVGDIDVAEARVMAERHFGRLERRAEPRHATFSEPEPTGHVRARFDERLGKMPAFHLAWRIPARPHPDAYVIDVLAEVLDGGQASRLTRKLARETGLATRHFAGSYGRRDVDLFHVFVELSGKGQAGADKARRIVRGALYDIATVGVKADELRRAKVGFEAGWVFGNLSFSGRAAMLARYELYEGDARRINGELARYRAVTSDDLKRVARKYFLYDREVELDVIPEGGEDPKDPDKRPRWLAKMEKRLDKALRKERKAEERHRKAEERRRKAEERRREAEESRRKAGERRREADEKRRKAQGPPREGGDGARTTPHDPPPPADTATGGAR